MASIMATIGSKHPKKREVAKLVTENRQPCVFCNEDVDDEVIYGKLYALGDIQCHYFCVLLSCCLVQKGRDSEGLFGFLYKDIQAEVERSKKHKCSYCGRGGASLGCSVPACRKQFHLPCGRRKNVVSLFYGNYKSFCELHAPKQKISEPVMVKAKERIKRDKLIRAGKTPVTVADIEDSKQTESPEDPASLCVICYSPVAAYPTAHTFWPPCCGRDAWLHRTCLQRMALSAGMHYLKCPLCNDKDDFYDAVCEQGYYLPDRDAAWELEQNAFAEMYNRDAECAAADCKCPLGRSHDELGMWDIKLCLLCGSWGMHAFCSGGERPVCESCRPAATDIEQLEARLTAVMLAEQARESSRARSGPVMPPRMSLRRTKGRPQHSASSSSQMPAVDSTKNKTEPASPSCALETGRKRPRRRPGLQEGELTFKEGDTRLLSPVKMLQQGSLERGGGHVPVSEELLDSIRLKFRKPKPLSAKKKIVNEILDDLFKNMFKETSKRQEPVMGWNSPRKACHITSDLNEEKKDNLEPILSTNIETEASENVDDKNLTDIEKVDINKPEDSNKLEENCEKEHQDIKHTPKKESKLDGESSKTHLNDNIREHTPKKESKLDGESSKTHLNDNIREHTPKKESKLDGESSKTHLNDNIREHTPKKESKLDGESSKTHLNDNIREHTPKKESKLDGESSKTHLNDNICEHTPEKESKLDGESSKTHLNENIRDAEMIKHTPEKKSNFDEELSKTQLNDNIRDAVITDNDNDDESSRSTLQLPSEFIAMSEESQPILDTPKKLKMVDIKHNSSIEISEKNEMLNIDVVQIGSGKEAEFIKNLTLKTPVKNRVYSFKFSPLDKEPLQEDVDMDVESFKDHYLNEVGRDKSSSINLNGDAALRSVDVNVESGIKRKLDMQDGVKKRRTNRETKKRRLKIKIKMNDKKRTKKMKRIKELKLKERMPPVGIKIKLKEKMKKNKKLKLKSYKQYVLKYSPLQTAKVIAKPDVDVAPMKRKYIKLDKPPDKLVQTSIQSFFKAK